MLIGACVVGQKLGGRGGETCSRKVAVSSSSRRALSPGRQSKAKKKAHIEDVFNEHLFLSGDSKLKGKTTSDWLVGNENRIG